MNRKIIQCCALLLLAVTAVKAQTVKIEDPNFKKALISQGVDLNGDGEIQVTEAQKVTRLYVEKRHIESLSGIKSFTNLEEFGFYNNELREADLQGMTKLKAVYGFSNQLEVLNLKGCTNLETLYAAYNQLQRIDLGGLNRLKALQLHNNKLLGADVSGKPLLEECQLNDNELYTFNAAGSTAIKVLRLDANMLESLNVTHLKDLEELNVYKNRQLTSLKVAGLRKLKELNAYYCALNNLNLSGTVSLRVFSW